jgi:hypothetical protein
MANFRLTAWLRPALTLLALAGIFSLAGCGGGNGAPNNPYVPPPPTLQVLPATTTIFSGVPDTLTITSGSAPFLAFTSNSAVLPVSSTVTNTVALFANPVTAEETVTLTIQDATGQRVTVPVTVKPSTLFPASITITGSAACGSTGATLCAGAEGTATITLNTPTGAPAAGRSVRFDVVLGTFSLIAANSTAPAQSVTVQTDQAGVAVVTIQVPPTALTQFATIRATDVASGSSVLGQFTIASTALSVIPTGKTTFTGPDKQTCSSGATASWYIFGGTPPYTVQASFPTAVSLIGSPVLQRGGSFSVVTNGTCFTGLTFAISDANGTVLANPPTVDNVVGTADVVVPLVLNPTTYPTAACNSGSTFPFLVSGGRGTFSAIVAPAAGATGTAIASSVSAGTFSVSFTTTGHGDFNVTITDGATIRTAVIHCAP